MISILPAYNPDNNVRFSVHAPYLGGLKSHITDPTFITHAAFSQRGLSLAWDFRAAKIDPDMPGVDGGELVDLVKGLVKPIGKMVLACEYRFLVLSNSSLCRDVR